MNESPLPPFMTSAEAFDVEDLLEPWRWLAPSEATPLTVISAQGQILFAQADCAVHTSPFLSDEERAKAMSLRYTQPAAAAAS